MSLRRVLVTIALVAVLASSLFSGWLSSALSPLKPLVAQAADQTLSEICRGSDSRVKASVDWSAGVPVVAMVTVMANNSVSINFTANLYRSVASESRYGSPVASASTTNGASFVKLTDSPTAGKYKYFVLVTLSSGEKDCSDESATYDTAAGSSGINAEKAQEWFGNKSLGTLNLRRFEEQGKPPYTIVNGDRAVNRPKIRFQLTHIGAEGYGGEIPVIIPIVGGSSSPIQWKNVDWYIFEAYDVSAGDDEAGEKINDLYILANDNQAENVVFDKDRTGILKGKFTELTHDFDISNADLDKLFGYSSFHVPKKTDEWSCKDAGEAVYTVGPSGADKKHYSETGHSGDARFLNGNCIVPDSGWPQYWGVSVNSVPYDASKVGCTSNFLSTALQKDIGQAITTVIGCFFQSILEKGMSTLIQFLTETSERSMIDPKQFVLAKASFGMGTAHAADLKDELKSNTSAIVTVWNYSRSLLNIVVVLALLAIAFANILHLNLNAYAAKKALPGIIIGVVGANASLLIIRFLVDVANAVGMLATQLGGTNTISALILKLPYSIGRQAVDGAIGVLAGLAPFALIGAIILILYFFFLILVFCWALFRRLVMLYFLIMISPLGFAAYGIPGAQQYFTKWWDLFLRYLFLLPVLLFGIAMVVKLGENLDTGSFLSTDQISPQGLINIMIMLAAASAILKLPSTITKGAIDVSEAAKKAFGIARQAPISGAGFMKNRNESYAKKMKNLYGDKSEQFKRADKKVKNWANWRGRSNIVANPQLLKAWYDARTKREEANTSIDTLSSKGKKIFSGTPLSYLYTNKDIPTPEIIKGRRAAMSEKENGALDRFKKSAAEFRGRGDPVAIAKQARQYSDRLEMFRAIREKLGPNFDPDHMTGEQQEFIASIPQASINDVYMEKLEDVIGEDPQNPDRLPGVEAMAHVANNWAAAQETVRQLMGPKTSRAVLIRETYKAMMQGFDAYDTATSDNRGDLPNSGLYSGASRRGGGGGGATNFGGAGGDSSSGGGNGGSQAVYVRGGTIDIRNIPELEQSMNDEIGKVYQHGQKLHEVISEDSLNNLASTLHNLGEGASQDIEAQARAAIESMVDVGREGGQALKDSLIGMTGEALKETAGHIQIAANGVRSPEAIQQRYYAVQQGSLAVEEANRNIASRIDDETINKLAAAIGGSFEQGLGAVKEAFGNDVDKLNETLKRNASEADKNRVLEEVLKELQQTRKDISGPGGRSLRGKIDSMASSIVKKLGVTQLSSSKMMMDAVMRRPDVVAEKPSGSVTVDPAPESQAQKPPTEEPPELPTLPTSNP